VYLQEILGKKKIQVLQLLLYYPKGKGSPGSVVKVTDCFFFRFAFALSISICVVKRFFTTLQHMESYEKKERERKKIKPNSCVFSKKELDLL